MVTIRKGSDLKPLLPSSMWTSLSITTVRHIHRARPLEGVSNKDTTSPPCTTLSALASVPACRNSMQKRQCRPCPYYKLILMLCP